MTTKPLSEEDWKKNDEHRYSEGYVTLEECTRRIEAAVKAERDSKNYAYWERNQLVRALSKLYPSHLCRHPEEDTEWENDWRWIVCIHLPTGQATWHIHDSEKPMFDHLIVEDNHWDGHTNEEKYSRIWFLSHQERTEK